MGRCITKCDHRELELTVQNASHTKLHFQSRLEGAKADAEAKIQEVHTHLP